MIKKLAAIILALALCAAFVGCAKDGTPDGMHSVTLEGEPFILYVPDELTENTASGVSSAYFSATDKIGVSARYFTPENPEMTLDEYVSMKIQSYADTLTLFNLKENGAAVLG